MGKNSKYLGKGIVVIRRTHGRYFIEKLHDHVKVLGIAD